jgi:two-component system, NarL family, sensor histidine kinase DesK
MNSKYPLATYAGAITWALVFGITLYLLQQLPLAPPWMAINGLFILYGAAFITLTMDDGPCSLTSRSGKVLLIVQLLSALSLMLILPARHFDYLTILTIIWVSMLPSVMSVARAMIVAVLLVILWFSLVAYLQQRNLWISALLYGAFHLFAVLMQSATQAEQKAKQALASKHQQLLATQQLLQAASRQSERSRIARNIHDVVGHHLTALTIQLQVAGHITQGDVKTQIDKCHQLAKLLLSDVREAVCTLRQYADITLLDAVLQLATLLPAQLQLKLNIAPDIVLRDLPQAQHLICIIQEAISNSLKHSGATEFYINASVAQGSLALELYDNGKVSGHLQPGNGIKGMQERAAEAGIALSIGKVHGAMQLTLRMPYQGAEHV